MQPCDLANQTYEGLNNTSLNAFENHFILNESHSLLPSLLKRIILKGIQDKSYTYDYLLQTEILDILSCCSTPLSVGTKVLELLHEAAFSIQNPKELLCTKCKEFYIQHSIMDQSTSSDQSQTPLEFESVYKTNLFNVHLLESPCCDCYACFISRNLTLLTNEDKQQALRLLFPDCTSNKQEDNKMNSNSNINQGNVSYQSSNLSIPIPENSAPKESSMSPSSFPLTSKSTDTKPTETPVLAQTQMNTTDLYSLQSTKQVTSSSSSVHSPKDIPMNLQSTLKNDAHPQSFVSSTLVNMNPSQIFIANGSPVQEGCIQTQPLLSAPLKTLLQQNPDALNTQMTTQTTSNMFQPLPITENTYYPYPYDSSLTYIYTPGLGYKPIMNMNVLMKQDGNTQTLLPTTTLFPGSTLPKTIRPVSFSDSSLKDSSSLLFTSPFSQPIAIQSYSGMSETQKKDSSTTDAYTVVKEQKDPYRTSGSIPKPLATKEELASATQTTFMPASNGSNLNVSQTELFQNQNTQELPCFNASSTHTDNTIYVNPFLSSPQNQVSYPSTNTQSNLVTGPLRTSYMIPSTSVGPSNILTYPNTYTFQTPTSLYLNTYRPTPNAYTISNLHNTLLLSGTNTQGQSINSSKLDNSLMSTSIMNSTTNSSLANISTVYKNNDQTSHVSKSSVSSSEPNGTTNKTNNDSLQSMKTIASISSKIQSTYLPSPTTMGTNISTNGTKPDYISNSNMNTYVQEDSSYSETIQNDPSLMTNNLYLNSVTPVNAHMIKNTIDKAMTGKSNKPKNSIRKHATYNCQFSFCPFHSHSLSALRIHLSHHDKTSQFCCAYPGCNYLTPKKHNFRMHIIRNGHECDGNKSQLNTKTIQELAEKLPSLPEGSPTSSPSSPTSLNKHENMTSEEDTHDVNNNTIPQDSINVLPETSYPADSTLETKSV